MLMIRLQRVGKRRMPTYRLIVSEKGRDTQDRYLENLGTYNPRAKNEAEQFQPKKDRIEFWMKQGAGASATIHNLMVKAGMIKADKRKSVFLSTDRKKKIEEKKKSAAPAA